MSESFDWRSIELPKGVDYDDLYQHMKDNPEVLDQLVRQYLSTNEQWLENERKIQALVRNREEVMKELRQTQENNRIFDELVDKLSKTKLKTTSITDTIYYDNEYTYYSEPIQRVVDIDQLRQRMNCLVLSQTKAKSETNIEVENKTTNTSEETQTDSKDNLSDVPEVAVVYDGIKATKQLKVEPKLIQTFERTDPKVNSDVFAASNGILTKSWEKAKISRIVNMRTVSVQFWDPAITGGSMLSHKLIAYAVLSNSVLPVGERVVAFFDEMEAFSAYSQSRLFSGTVAEPAKYTNGYRYLIFFDRQAYRYVKREHIFLIYDKVSGVLSVENIFTDLEIESKIEIKEYAEFLRKYIKNYPERPMVRLQKDDRIKVRFNDKWETTRVVDIDSSLALMLFEDLPKPHKEWIYRGSRRLYDIYKECHITKSNIKHRSGRSTTRMTRKPNQAFVEWNTEETEDDKENKSTTSARKDSQSDDEIMILDKEQVSRKRKFKQTARKSTAKPSMASTSLLDPMKVIEEELLNEVEVEKLPDLSRFSPKEFDFHYCSADCINVEAESDGFRDQNPYHIPIIVGYRREIVKTSSAERRTRILYRAPCGRRLRDINEVFNYLLITNSKLDIDLFTFSFGFALFRKSSPVKTSLYIEDISNGLEPQPISCVNTVDNSNLGNVVYRNERFPHPDVKFKLDPNFLPCCDCTDNCMDSESCACQRLTHETSDAIRLSKYQSVGYEYKRLNDFLMTGTFECNARCQCNDRCPNRVVQNGIKCRLQLFKTLKKGWGVRVLHDVPKGAFLCIYAAQILNEEAADKEGKTCGDEYLADLDYIDVCENQKEGYESDAELSDEDYRDDEEDEYYDEDDDDEDYKYYGSRRSRLSVEELPLENRNIISGGRKRNDDKLRNRFSIREDFFKEDFCYSLDAKKEGNIGRYLNHSCEPNCFVQNVFVDTHDLRFPWVSFFAKKDILAYEELTWDYNYEIGSIPDRKLPCYCGAHRCKKRLL